MAADYDAEDLEQLWRATLEKYKTLTGVDLEDQQLTREQMDERIKNIRGYKSDVIRASMANMLELGEIVSQVVSSV